MSPGHASLYPMGITGPTVLKVYDECYVSELRSIVKFFVYQSLYINMTMTDTSISQVLSESHSVIYGVSEEAKPQAKEVSLV